MTASPPASASISLVAVDGPTPATLDLSPPGPATIGRSTGHALELNDAHVSRNHAVLTYRRDERSSASGPAAPRWLLTDSGSRHGTWLNGVRLTPQVPLPVSPGDLIAIAPWTFRVVDPATIDTGEHSLVTLTETASSEAFVTQMDAGAADHMAAEQLSLLLRCASAIHAAVDEQALGRAVLDALATGTGFENAAMLRPRGEQIEMVAWRGSALEGVAAPQLSRSLIRQAAGGRPARLTWAPEQATQQSIVDLNIRQAMCIPIMIEQTVAGFLYLDDRGGDTGRRRPGRDPGAFAIGLARLAAMALAGLRRLDVERRLARVEAELEAAGEIQATLLQQREGTCGRFRFSGECRPGRQLGGDFFDIIPLPDGRLAVALGDVTGKSVPASVLMTTAHGFLHAALTMHGDPGRALTELNRFVHPRCPADRFITLWVGVFDGDAGEFACVDAGHGHALLQVPDAGFDDLSTEKHVPIGIIEDTEYTVERRKLPVSGRAIVVSDGLIEEPNVDEPPDDPTSGMLSQFSIEGVKRCLAAVPGETGAVRALFDAVREHAGRATLADDATAVIVAW